MSFFFRLKGHLKTVFKHKHLVRKYCWACGLYWQGIAHDMTKFSPTEFSNSVHYYRDGKKSPTVGERKEKGYSETWLHHKGRNKHHIEYWTDYVLGKGFTGIPMPFNYLVESICDRLSACKVYNGDAYKQTDPLRYFRNSREGILIHPDTADQFDFYFSILAEKGEEAMFKVLKKEVQFFKKVKKKTRGKVFKENLLYPRIWRKNHSKNSALKSQLQSAKKEI